MKVLKMIVGFVFEREAYYLLFVARPLCCHDPYLARISLLYLSSCYQNIVFFSTLTCV
jgi:hypothetical protein